MLGAKDADNIGSVYEYIHWMGETDDFLRIKYLLYIDMIYANFLSK